MDPDAKRPRARKHRLTEPELLQLEARRAIQDFESLALVQKRQRRELTLANRVPQHIIDNARRLNDRPTRRRRTSEDFLVSEIVGERICDGSLCEEDHAKRREFCVRFAGYSADDDQWLPAKKVDAPRLVKAYRAVHSPPPPSPDGSTDVSDGEGDNGVQVNGEVQLSTRDFMEKFLQSSLGDLYEGVVGILARTDSEASCPESALQMPVEEPSTSAAALKQPPVIHEPVESSIFTAPSSPQQPTSPQRPISSPSAAPPAAREATPEPQEADLAGHIEDRLQLPPASDEEFRHLLPLPGIPPTGHEHLLADLQLRRKRYHEATAAEKARYRFVKDKESISAIASKLLAHFEASRSDFSYRQWHDMGQGVRQGLYPLHA
ncbi:hypothetical protein AAVH_29451 [Aphelenchoides avenae]|nr:hypothetical protein AAVH_29451 [Aphelenchus avenae]